LKTLLSQLSEKQLLYILERLRLEYFQAQVADIPTLKEKKQNIDFEGIREMLILLGQVSDAYANKISALAIESQNPALLKQVVTMGPLGSIIRITSMILINHLINPLVRLQHALANGLSPLERDYAFHLLKNTDAKTAKKVISVIDAWNEEEQQKYLYHTDTTPFSTLILTPKPVEFKAVVKQLNTITDVLYAPTNTFYRTGYFGKHRIAVRETGAGNYVMAAETERATSLFQPQFALLVGMAGGVSDKKVSIGDIVVGDQSYYYESGMETTTAFLSRQRGDSYDQELVELSKFISNQAPIKWQRFTNHQQKYQTRIGTIAAGEKVVTTSKTKIYDLIQQNCQDALAVEMEAVGFSYALKARRKKIKGLNIRSISDMLDGKEAANKKGSRELASENAAAFAFELLSQMKSPPSEKIN